jgi:hypothetical protein
MTTTTSRLYDAHTLSGAAYHSRLICQLTLLLLLFLQFIFYIHAHIVPNRQIPSIQRFE